MAFVLITISLISGAMEPAEVIPRGELAARIALVQDRMLHGEEPAFTDDFILADVALRPDYPRRFSNFSGDISGRVLSALAMMPPEEAYDLEGLVEKILACQKDDGRFGAMDLDFTPEEIGREHMALLWGNGRLLAGLMEYHAVSGSSRALAGSQKLGDFLLSVRKACSHPDVVKRLEGQAAHGYICFTQLIEGLVMLHQADGDVKWLDGAAKMAEWFQRERGKQHTHGYLSTLRGMLMLYNVTGEKAMLDTVEEAYAGVTASPDYLIYGGVPEFFSNVNNRDEGCSVADFLRLSLQLFLTTGKAEYLEKGEHCLLNHFYGNQFFTGDFGHHILTSHGFSCGESTGRAWWCCTMHGLRAFRDVLDSVATEEEKGLKLNLFVDAAIAVPGLKLETGWKNGLFEIRVIEADATEKSIAVRKPAWANTPTCAVNGEVVEAVAADGALSVTRAWKAGDVIEIRLQFKTRLRLKKGGDITPDALTESPQEAALFFGPWLMGVDAATDPMFHGEPWSENVLYLNDAVPAFGKEAPFRLPLTHMNVPYLHGGFPDIYPVTLRPFSEQTCHMQNTFSVWLRYAKKQ